MLSKARNPSSISLTFVLSVPILIYNILLIAALDESLLIQSALAIKSFALLTGTAVVSLISRLDRVRVYLGIGGLAALAAETIGLYHQTPTYLVRELLYIGCIVSIFIGLSSWIEISNSYAERLSEERDHLEILSSSDSLTELKNKRAFESALSSLSHESWMILLTDIDDFKRINDNHGHSAGDVYLTQFAQVLLASTRHHDEVYRIGGEEFAVIIKGSFLHAETVSKRILSAVKKLSVQSGENTISATCSIGGATLMHEYPKESIEHADKMLYSVKGNGKDNYLIYAVQ